ncbi:MAG: YHS domain-containing (seleno)protein [Pseudomonadota bacterium]
MTKMMSRRTAMIAFGAVLIGGAAATQIPATQAKAGKPLINQIGSKGVAIKGFDPVAYFTVGKPTKGTSEHTSEYKGATWKFASAENKALFDGNPEKYAPAYGGYCAYGVAQGALVKIEGNAWAIRNGKLYLNYNRSVQNRWAKKPASFIKTANTKWPKLIGNR